jgi:hypothetical protein
VQRLHIDQTVTLSLDEVPDSIQCRVLDVRGSVSRLSYRDELPPRMVGMLVLGAGGYLVFDEFRAAVGLRVAVRASPPYLDVAFTDGVAVTERRSLERVKLVTRARIICPDEPDRPPESTYTVDLSEGGALLRHRPAFEEHQRFMLEFMFGDDPQPITAQAEVVRRVEDAVGVAFDSMDANDAARLGGYLMGIRHQRRPASHN